jgi:hypothetical protein
MTKTEPRAIASGLARPDRKEGGQGISARPKVPAGRAPLKEQRAASRVGGERGMRNSERGMNGKGQRHGLHGEILRRFAPQDDSARRGAFKRGTRNAECGMTKTEPQAIASGLARPDRKEGGQGISARPKVPAGRAPLKEQRAASRVGGERGMRNSERGMNGKGQRHGLHVEIPFDSAALCSGQAFAALRMTKQAARGGRSVSRPPAPGNSKESARS